MKTPDKPKNEAQRLEKLRSLKILDTESEDRFDRIVLLASLEADCTTSLISLIDDKRQWFKSKTGIDALETERDISFCGHAINSVEPLIIEDATKDERFFDNPFCINSPNIVFYAGFPLVTDDGYALGTLCVIDNHPKKLSEKQILKLTELSKIVLDLLELRLKEIENNRLISLFKEVESISKTGGWTLNPKTGQTYWTDQVYSIYGVDKSTLTSKDQGISQYAEEEKKRLNKLIEDAIEYKISFDGEFKFFDSSGVEKWVRAKGTPVVNDNDEVIEIIGSFQDITSVHKTELEFDKINHFFKDTIENMPAIFYAKKNDGKYIGVNENFLRFFNWTKDELVNVTDFDLFPKELAEQFRSNDEKIFQKRETLFCEEIAFNFKGDKRIFNSYKFPYIDSNGDCFAMGGIYIDVTEARSIEQQALHHSKLTTIGELAAGIGHEINNPLTVVKAYSEFLFQHRSISFSKKEKEVYLKLQKSIKRIANIANGIRNFSRLDSEVKQSFNIEELVLEVSDFMKELFKRDGIIFEYEFIGSTSSKAFGSAGKIEQVLINVLKNSVDALKEVDSPKLVFKTTCFDKIVIFSIEDNGTGIDKALEQQIFEPFFTTKDPGTGTGIGLSLSKKIMLEHGGDITLVNQKERGVTFEIKLPLFFDNLENAVPNESNDISENNLVNINEEIAANIHILLVDDEEGVRDSFKYTIDQNISVTECCNGEEAIELLKNKDFDIIFSDANMPVMDGVTLLKKLRFMNKETPFVFITGGTSKFSAEIKDKFDGIIFKPFEKSSIDSMLIQAVKGRK